MHICALYLEETQEFWNLGSILCYSNYSTVCGEFMVYPAAESTDGECTAPGCGWNSVQDLANTCINIDKYKYNHKQRLNRVFKWADSLLIRTNSSCEEKNYPFNCR